jgi:outer membrane receptor for ferrienterochelin and colicins
VRFNARSWKRAVWRLAALVAFTARLAPTPVAAQDSGRCGPTASAKTGDVFTLDLQSLLDVKVTTASKFPEPASDAPGMISVISADALRRFGAVTVADVLARVPGLTTTTAYFTDRSIVAARGDQTKIDGGHLLILINGRPSREILEGGIVSDLLESFPVSALQQVEVVKGPGSVLYGSNAFSAVINLITRRADANGFTVNAAPTQPGGGATSADGTFRCGDFSIIGSAQFHVKPDWSTTYRFPTPPIPDPLAPPLPAVQQITIPNSSSGSYVGASYKALSVMSSFTEWRTSAFVRGTVGENQWKRFFSDVGYHASVSRRWDMNVDLTYTRNMFGIEAFPNISRDSSETVVEWTNTLTPSDRDRVTFGALYNYVQGQELYLGLGEPIPISDASRNGGAWYAQAEHRLSKSMKMIGGFQINKIGDLDVSAVPRAGVVWSPIPSMTVKTLFAKAFRAPSINETHLNHPVLKGTPDLRPEEVGTLDVGVAYHRESFQLDGSVFHTRQTDSITTDVSRPLWRYVNLGGATFNGIELEGKYYVHKDVYLLGSMMHQTNRDETGNANVTPIANTNVKGGVSYDRPGAWTFSVFDDYQGAVPGYTSNLNPAPDAHHLLNAYARIEMPSASHSRSGVAFYVYANNLTNKPLWLPAWGENAAETIPSIGGRTIYFGVEFSSRKGTPRGPHSSSTAAHQD